MVENYSYKDPSGFIKIEKERVLRFITNLGKDDYDLLKKNKTVKELIKKKKLISFKEIKKNNSSNKKIYKVIEHPKLDFITYPYEWPFDQLKDAAIFFLDLYVLLVKNKINLKDSSAYNIQFENNKPVLIDILSLTKYKKDSFWHGFNQFQNEFLNPLLLKSIKNIDYNKIYYSNIEGIETNFLDNIIPFYKNLNINFLLSVKLKKFLFSKNINYEDERSKIKYLDNKKLENIINYNLSYIKSLKLKKNPVKHWLKYPELDHYSKKDEIKKKNIVKKYVNKSKPKCLLDIGCNVGNYSFLAIKSNAQKIISIDSDHDCINYLYNLAKKGRKKIIPMVVDLINPNANIGFNNKEKFSFLSRIENKIDFVLSLAIVHHFVFQNNISLTQTLKMIIKLGKRGIIEYIPKNDVMLKKMIDRKTIYHHDYNLKNFELILSKSTKYQKKEIIKENGRILFYYEK